MADIEENARRKSAEKKEILLSPIAIEVVRRIDALFAIERSINGQSPEERLAVRRAVSRPLVDDLMTYARAGGEAIAGARPRQGDPVHAQARVGLHAVPRRRTRVPTGFDITKITIS
jgi:Transposase IS66 family